MNKNFSSKDRNGSLCNIKLLTYALVMGMLSLVLPSACEARSTYTPATVDADGIVTRYEIKTTTKYYDTEGNFVRNEDRIAGVDYKTTEEKELIPHFYKVWISNPKADNNIATKYYRFSQGVASKNLLIETKNKDTADIVAMYKPTTLVSSDYVKTPSAAADCSACEEIVSEKVEEAKAVLPEDVITENVQISGKSIDNVVEDVKPSKADLAKLASEEKQKRLEQKELLKYQNEKAKQKAKELAKQEALEKKTQRDNEKVRKLAEQKIEKANKKLKAEEDKNLKTVNEKVTEEKSKSSELVKDVSSNKKQYQLESDKYMVHPQPKKTDVTSLKLKNKALNVLVPIQLRKVKTEPVANTDKKIIKKMTKTKNLTKSSFTSREGVIKLV